MWFLFFAITLIKRSSNTFTTLIPLWIGKKFNTEEDFSDFPSLIPSIDWHLNIIFNRSLIFLWICSQVWLQKFGIVSGKEEKNNIGWKKHQSIFMEWILMFYLTLRARKTLFLNDWQLIIWIIYLRSLFYASRSEVCIYKNSWYI